MEALKGVAAEVAGWSSGKQQALFLSGVGSLVFGVHKLTGSLISARNRKRREADKAAEAEGNTPRIDPLTGELVANTNPSPIDMVDPTGNHNCKLII